MKLSEFPVEIQEALIPAPAGDMVYRCLECGAEFDITELMYTCPTCKGNAEARFSTLLNLPEGADLGKAINAAMTAIERENKDLEGVLPKTYTGLDNRTLVTLLKTFNVSLDVEGDAFGKIYEYFLGKFAMGEGQKGGD